MEPAQWRRKMMAIKSPPVSGELTYEQYLAEGEINRRYDIVDGERIYMPGPTWRHQRIQFNIQSSLHRFEESSGNGFALGAPYDVLIQRSPLRTRQPDALFISKTQLNREMKGGGIPDADPPIPHLR
jgi:Uma2 family endonuclease